MSVRRHASSTSIFHLSREYKIRGGTLRVQSGARPFKLRSWHIRTATANPRHPILTADSEHLFAQKRTQGYTDRRGCGGGSSGATDGCRSSACRRLGGRTARLPRSRRASGAEVLEAFQPVPNPPAPAPGVESDAQLRRAWGADGAFATAALLRRRPKGPKGLLPAARQELLDPSKAWWGGRRGRLADRPRYSISVSLGVVPLVLPRRGSPSTHRGQGETVSARRSRSGVRTAVSTDRK